MNAPTRLLIVDDDDVLRTTLARRYRNQGLEVADFPSAEAALAAPPAGQWDVALLDLHLPGIDGEEVLRRLRADPRTADLPVVMVSADVTPWYRERLLEAGAADYLTKPLDVPRFLEVVNGLLVAATR